ncbi:MAG TPA: RNA polymerase sigma-70 factor [Parapedobacter sp.]|nr:RNA polymerase sigma-70 factor [Parapedobacter sp.]
MIDDVTLLKGLIAGNRKLFTVLFDQYWKELYAYVVRLAKDKEESIDIVQETFASLWQQREELSHVKSLRGYIYAMVHHKAVQFIKSSVRHRHYVDSLSSYIKNSGYSLEDELDHRDLAAFIASEIDKLPPRAREIFLMSRNEDLSYKEIAHKLSIAENTVRKQVSFSIKYLRMKINKAYCLFAALLVINRLTGF